MASLTFTHTTQNMKIPTVQVKKGKETATINAHDVKQWMNAGWKQATDPTRTEVSKPIEVKGKAK